VQQPSLHDLIGISTGCTPATLRHAYEQAVRTATRAGDHRRAMALSAAFDALPLQLRNEVFPGRAQVACRPVPLNSVRQGSAERGAAVYSTARHGGRSRLGGRVLAVATALAVVALVGLYVKQTAFPSTPHLRDQSVPQNVGDDQQQQGTAASTLQVPDDAPVGTDGRVTVICSPTATQLGFTLQAVPGQVVSCGGGVVPVLSG
jgi:hypothetical protein